MAKRGLRSDPVATRKGRRLAVDADTSSSTSTYGGAVAFKNAWKELPKDGWMPNHYIAKAWAIDSDTFGLEETRQGRKVWTFFLGKLQ
ncbi:hypothetical protein PI125_g20925 [Phytophthora idaei]|nr:hypothetical protein PI125_g20925 [Phytophthora idaei]